MSDRKALLARAMLWIGLASGAAACSSVAPSDAPAAVATPPRTIVGEPRGALAVARVDVTLEGTARALGTRGPLAVVATDRGVALADATGSAAVSALSVLAAPGEPSTTGTVAWLAPRRDGLLVLAEGGLFHDAGRALVLSPAWSALRERGVSRVDALGDGADEELWLVSAEGLLHLRGGVLREVRVGASAAPPEIAIGVGPGLALAAAGGRVVLVDVGARTVTTLAEGTGRASDAARGDDGAAHVATERGLVSRSADGAVAVRTFAPEGAPPVAVTSVAAKSGRVVAAVGGHLVEIGDDASFVLAEGVASAPRSVAVDGAGDTWLVTGSGVARLATGGAVSFARHVAPLLTQKCSACHATGASGAPALALQQLEAARALAPLIHKRLRADGVPPMPPARVEALAQEKIAVFTRWIEGGMLP